MKLKELAFAVGQRVPFVMTLQKKYGLPVTQEYPEVGETMHYIGYRKTEKSFSSATADPARMMAELDG